MVLINCHKIFKSSDKGGVKLRAKLKTKTQTRVSIHGWVAGRVCQRGILRYIKKLIYFSLSRLGTEVNFLCLLMMMGQRFGCFFWSSLIDLLGRTSPLKLNVLVFENWLIKLFFDNLEMYICIQFNQQIGCICRVRHKFYSTSSVGMGYSEIKFIQSGIYEITKLRQPISIRTQCANTFYSPYCVVCTLLSIHYRPY